MLKTQKNKAHSVAQVAPLEASGSWSSRETRGRGSSASNTTSPAETEIVDLQIERQWNSAEISAQDCSPDPSNSIAFPLELSSFVTDECDASNDANKIKPPNIENVTTSAIITVQSS